MASLPFDFPPSEGVDVRYRFTPEGDARRVVIALPPAPVKPLSARHTTFPPIGGTFRQHRDFFARALVKANAADRPVRMIDYAQFLIGQMMLPEARGLVEQALQSMPTSDRTQLARAEGYRALIGYLMDPDQPRIGTGFDLPKEWAHDPLWSTLLGQQGGVRDAGQIRHAMRQAEAQTRALAGVVMVPLFNAALDLEDANLARDVVELATDRTDLAGSDRMRLMRGLLAQLDSDDKTAFDFFAWAAEGRGRAAAEARLEIVDLALARSDASLLPKVLVILKEGVAQWHGDALALRTRARLAEVAETLVDLETAILVMADIQEEFPGTPEAKLADTRMSVVMRHLVERIEDGRLGLEDSMTALRRIGPRVATRTEWIDARLALAGKLTDAGLLSSGAAEYTAIWKDLDDLGAASISHATHDRLTLQNATALVAMGQMDAARAVLARKAPVHDTSPIADFARLAARIDGQTEGEADTLTDPQIRLAVARHAVLSGADETALQAYDAALGSAEDERPDDQIHALRLAAKLEKRVTLQQGGADALPAPLRAAMTPVLTGLAAPLPTLEPIAVDVSRGMLETAKTTTRAVEELLAAID